MLPRSRFHSATPARHERRDRSARSGRASLLALGAMLVFCGLGWFLYDPAAREARVDAPALKSGSGEAPHATELEAPTAPRDRDDAPASLLDKARGVEARTSSEPSLDPDARLVVRVLDARGEPVVGVSIEWVLIWTMGQLSDGIIEGVSDAAGRIPIAETTRGLQGRFGKEPPFAGMVAKLGLRCTLPFEAYQPTDEDAAPGVLWLDTEPEHGAVIDLVLPPSGAVRFEWDALVDGRGEPLEAPFLHIRRSDGKHFPGWRTGFNVPVGVTEHLFTPVGLGWEVYGALSHGEVVGTLGTVRAPGPTVAGETTVARIELEPAQLDLAYICGVALDAGGVPVSQRRLHAALGDPDERSAPQRSVLTDATGAWSFNVRRDQLAPRLTVLAPGQEGEPRGEALLDLSDPERRAFEVGEITLVPTLREGSAETVLVRGRVTDTAGVALQDAYVSVKAQVRTRGGKPIDDSEAWTELGPARTNRSGLYEAQAAVELSNAMLRVCPSHRDCLSAESMEVPAGSVGVDFALTRGAAISLQVDADPWAVMSESITLRFAGESRSNQPSLMDFYGHYGGRFSGLAEGSYTLSFLIHGGDWVLHRQVVEVRGDVELGTVDLRGRLALCHLRLLALGGAAVPKGYVHVVDAATRTTIDRSAKVDERGQLDLVVPADVSALKLHYVGHGTAEIPASLFVVPEAGVAPVRTTITLVR